MSLKEKLAQIISRDHMNDDERLTLIHTIDSIGQKTDVTVRDGIKSFSDFVVAVGRGDQILGAAS